MIRAGISLWLRDTPLTGSNAFLCAFACLAWPTAIRAAVTGVVVGCEFTPYLPFVLLAAILLRWWQAAAIALACVAILGGLFVSPIHDLACFISSAAMFLGSSAAMIGAMILIRGAFAVSDAREDGGTFGDVVFSLEEGEVWANWRGRGSPKRLGSQQMVSRMMEDFLAESEIGERLTRPRR